MLPTLFSPYAHEGGQLFTSTRWHDYSISTEIQIYRHIVLPLLRPVTLSAVIILGHISLKIFDLIVAISGKDLRLDVPAIYMWTTTFDGNNYARGATIGIFMLVTVAVLIIPYLINSMRAEEEL